MDLPEVRLLQFLLDVGGDQVNGHHVGLPAEASKKLLNSQDTSTHFALAWGNYKRAV